MTFADFLRSSVVYKYDLQSILTAALLTMAMAVALTLYAFFTETDFTQLGGLLCVIAFVVIMGALIHLVLDIK